MVRKRGGTPPNPYMSLLRAVQTDNLEGAMEVLDAAPWVLNAGDAGSDGKMMIHEVSTDGSIEMLHLLMDRGADLDSRDQLGQTCLMFASALSRHEMVRELVEVQRVNLEARDVYGCSALDMSVLFGALGSANYLLDRGGKITAMTKFMWKEWSEEEPSLSRTPDAQALKRRLMRRVRYVDLNVGAARVTRNTERIGSNVLPENGPVGQSASSRRYFYNTSNVRANGAVSRVFNASLLDHESVTENPFTRRPWPLSNVNAARQVLRRVGDPGQAGQSRASGRSNNAISSTPQARPSSSRTAQARPSTRSNNASTPQARTSSTRSNNASTSSRTAQARPSSSRTAQANTMSLNNASSGTPQARTSTRRNNAQANTSTRQNSRVRRNLFGNLQDAA